MAQGALRRLHATLVKKLDPGIAHDLLSRDLLTQYEMEKIEAGKTNMEKTSAIMAVLERKDAEKVLRELVGILEGEDGVDKQANAHVLKKIAEGKKTITP